MTTWLAGVDMSVTSVDAAFIPLDHEEDATRALFRTVAIKRLDGGAERIRDAHKAARGLYHELPGDLATVVVERPAGLGWYALLPVFGAIIAATPQDATVTWLTATEWRRDLALPQRGELKNNSKDYARAWLAERDHWLELDEHRAEALCVAVAWRQRLERRAA